MVNDTKLIGYFSFGPKAVTFHKGPLPKTRKTAIGISKARQRLTDRLEKLNTHHGYLVAGIERNSGGWWDVWYNGSVAECRNLAEAEHRVAPALLGGDGVSGSRESGSWASSLRRSGGPREGRALLAS